MCVSVYLHTCAHARYACGCRCSHATACPSEGISPCLHLCFPAASFSGSSGLTDARVRHLACVRTPGIQIGVLMLAWQPLLPTEPPPPSPGSYFWLQRKHSKQGCFCEKHHNYVTKKKKKVRSLYTDLESFGGRTGSMEQVRESGGRSALASRRLVWD